MARTLSLAPTIVPTLDDLAADPERAIGLSSGERAQLVTRCAAVLAALAGSMLTTDVVEYVAPGRETAESDRLLTVQEAAPLMGFATSYVYEMTRRGAFPCIRRGKYVRIRRSAIEQWLAEHEFLGVDRQLNTMLSGEGDRYRGEATSANPGTQANRVRRKARRASDHRESVGTRHRQHSGADRTPDRAAGQDREDTTP